MIKSWTAWFTHPTGYKRYSSKGTDFKDLPDDGCLAIVVFDSGGRMFLNGYDFYFMFTEVDGNQMIGTDIAQRERNIESEIKRRYNVDKLILGKWTSEEIMKQVQLEMKDVV